MIKVSSNSTINSTILIASNIPATVVTTAISTTIPSHTVVTQMAARKSAGISSATLISATATSDVQIIGSSVHKSFTLNAVLQELCVECYMVSGDGSCLYHAVVAHQAGFISRNSRDDKNISAHLCQLAVNMMTNHPAVYTEGGLTVI